MSKKKKIGITIAATIAAATLLSVIICVGVLRYSGIFGSMGQGPEGLEETLAFAKANDQQGCLVEALKRSKGCAQEAAALDCQQGHKRFLHRCIKNAAPSPTLCQGTPTPADGVAKAPAILEAYTGATCERLGHKDDLACAQLVQLVALECQLSRIQAKDQTQR